MNALELERVAVQARDQGSSVEYAIFAATAGRHAVRLAWVASIGLGISEANLISVSAELWTDATDGDRRDAAQTLVRWPLVEHTAEGIRVAEWITPVVASDFRTSDPERFVAAHRLLADMEERAELTSGSPDEWYARGRLAFYLAGVDSNRSASDFRTSFVSAPVFDRFLCRLWLSGLVEHQSYLLEDHQREVRFFKGFRQYTLGNRMEALSDFIAVIEADVEDELTAIALHLAGGIRVGRNYQQGMDWLQRSIQLSERLKFLDNEVMARNTLVWARVRNAQSTHAGMSLSGTPEIARTNVARARTSSDPSLIAWTLRTSATVRWLSLTHFAQHIESSQAEAAPELLAALNEAERIAIDVGEFETSALAANDAAGIYRDLAQYDRGLDQIEDAINAFSWLRAPLAAFLNLVKTAGSIRGRTTDPDMVRRADDLIERMLPFLPQEQARAGVEIQPALPRQ